MQSNGRFAVETGRARAILECQSDVRQIAQGHNAVAIDLDRQVVDIALIIKRRWDLDGERAGCGFNFARGDQLVVVDHNADQLVGGDVVGFEAQGIDHNLEHLVAVPGQSGL